MSATAGRPGGLTWNEQGLVGLSGDLFALAQRLDDSFVALSRRFKAQPCSFTPLLAVDEMRRLDYFSSFPQLVTFPTVVDGSEQALRAFRERNGRQTPGPLEVERTAPIQAILAPAACYAVYSSLQGTSVPGPRIFTTCGTCFRREDHYEPLRRQWSFRMREIVHIGTAQTAQEFLAEARDRVTLLARAWGLPISYQTATDPFFDPARSPKFMHQKLFPTKQEMILEGGLAVGSFNYHRNYFGEAFDLRTGPDVAHSACVAFGLERWLYAILSCHGHDPAGWPTVQEP